MNDTIRYNIKKILRSQGREQQDLYGILGISKQAFHARVSGNLTIRALQEIADALGCSAPELLIEPCKKIVDVDCANNEPVISNLIECPNCGMKMYVSAIKDLK